MQNEAYSMWVADLPFRDEDKELQGQDEGPHREYDILCRED